MGLNMYKILQKQELEDDLINQSYHVTDVKEECGLRLKFFYKTSNQNEIKWRNIFELFNVHIDFRTKDIRGLIIVSFNNNDYAITYGNSGHIAQRYCDVDFGFELARKIELKELKRKSTNAQRSRGRKAEVNTYVNESNLETNSGTIFTSLSFTPVDESLGKRIDFGKSIKFSFDLDVNQLASLLSKLETFNQSSTIINKIPYLHKVSDPSLIDDYDLILLNELGNIYSSSLSNSSLNLNLKDISIIGASIYFEQEYAMKIKYGKYSKEVSVLDLAEIFDFVNENSLSLADLIAKGRVSYIDDEGKNLFSEPIYNFISFDIPDKKVSLYEGKWNEYNDDFISIIKDSIEKIEVIYDSTFDNMDNLSENTEGDYKEERIINYLCSVIQAVSIDKSMYRLPYETSTFKNRFSIELGDLIINSSEYCSLKQGDIKSFNYCFDQSVLAAEIISGPRHETEVPKVISVWLFMRKIPMNHLGVLDLTAMNSIMLQRKIALWRSDLMRLGFSYQIRVNKL